jgi:hypothetical protein
MRIYIKKIAKILKQDFITAEQLKSYQIKSYQDILVFANIYNNLIFAPEDYKKKYLNKTTSHTAFKAFFRIIKELKKLTK